MFKRLESPFSDAESTSRSIFKGLHFVPLGVLSTFAGSVRKVVSPKPQHHPPPRSNMFIVKFMIKPDRAGISLRLLTHCQVDALRAKSETVLFEGGVKPQSVCLTPPPCSSFYSTMKTISLTMRSTFFVQCTTTAAMCCVGANPVWVVRVGPRHPRGRGPK